MIEVLVTVLLSLGLISVLVLIHEVGHFVAARKLGVVAEEFGLGLPPFARKLFNWRGTDFTLNWLPLGGFVRMRGEDPTSSADSELHGAGLEKEGFFYAQKPWKRAVILVAGVTMNVILGVFLFSLAYSALGIPQPGKIVTIDAVTIGSPADKAQLRPGDVVQELKIQSEKLKVEDTKTFIDFVNAHRGEEITFGVKRGQEDVRIMAVPRIESETPAGEGALGVAVSNIEFVRYPWWQMPIRASWVGIQEALGWGGNIVGGLGVLGRELLHGRFPSDLAGPVGIAKITSHVAKQGWIPLTQFAGILSINLAVINVLPIPALDGGRLLFLAIEKLRGHPINPRKEHWAHLVGYAVLIGFILLVSVHDLLRG